MATETFGQRLRRLRTRRNISQDQMAEALRTTRQTISNWENDKSAIDYFSLRDIHSILFCPWEELMEDDYKSELFKPNAYDSTMNDNAEYCKVANEHGLLLARTNIAGLSKAGDYSFSSDDLRIATKFLYFPASMCSLAKEMKMVGYTILDAGPTWITVRFKTDDEAKQYKQFLEDVCLPTYSHEPRYILTQKRYSTIVGDTLQKLRDVCIRDIFDIKDDENIYAILPTGGGAVLGYAGSVEKAKVLAKELGQEHYVIRQEEF